MMPPLRRAGLFYVITLSVLQETLHRIPVSMLEKPGPMLGRPYAEMPTWSLVSQRCQYYMSRDQSSEATVEKH